MLWSSFILASTAFAVARALEPGQLINGQADTRFAVNFVGTGR